MAFLPPLNLGIIGWLAVIAGLGIGFGIMQPIVDNVVSGLKRGA